MNKTIKINSDLKISWKLVYNLSENSWFITIYDNNHRISQNSKFEKYENINQAIDQLNFDIIHEIIYKKAFSIMKYYKEKLNYGLSESWDQVDRIRQNINYFYNHDLIEKVNNLYDNFINKNKIKIDQFR